MSDLTQRLGGADEGHGRDGTSRRPLGRSADGSAAGADPLRLHFYDGGRRLVVVQGERTIEVHEVHSVVILSVPELEWFLDVAGPAMLARLKDAVG